MCHYAGDVSYEINSFIDKNRDTVSDIINDTLAASSSQLLKNLFKKEEQPVAANSGPSNAKKGPGKAPV